MLLVVVVVVAARNLATVAEALGPRCCFVVFSLPGGGGGGGARLFRVREELRFSCARFSSRRLVIFGRRWRRRPRVTRSQRSLR